MTTLAKVAHRACERKRAHTQESAEIEARRLSALESEEIIPYECKFCPAWHTGHAKPKGKR
jgi:hypothetical protein